MPILARHAVSLSIAFALGLVLSYFAGQYIYQQIQLGKLTSTDQATFEHGVGYVVTKAGTSELVTAEALEAVQTIDPQRAADLLLAVAQSHAGQTDVKDPPIPDAVNDAVAPLMKRMSAKQAIGLYDGLVQVAGIDAIRVSEDLLNSLKPKDDAELLQIVNLLDTRLLWSRRWAPLDLWVRWLGVLAESESELTQFNTAKRIGELPEAVDEPDIAAALGTLAKSKFDTVRNVVLKVVAGYAAIAKDPTDYEQLIFSFGEDENKTIARRAWMIVGHLKPLSGFAVNWKDADPFIAEAILWAAVKTNPENYKPIWEAYENLNTQGISFQSLALINGQDKDTKYKQALFSGELSDRPNLYWRHLMTMTNGPLLMDLDPNEEAISKLLNAYRRIGTAPHTDQWSWHTHSGPLFAAIYCGYEPHPYQTENDLLRAAINLARGEGYTNRTHDPHVGFDEGTPIYVKLLVAASGGTSDISFRDLGTLVKADYELLSHGTIMLTHNDATVYDRDNWENRIQDVANPGIYLLNGLYAGMTNAYPKVISGITIEVLKKNPDIDRNDLYWRDEEELNELGLRLIDGITALLEAAESAPPSADRTAEIKLLKLALWMRGDLGDDFSPTAEAMLFDDEVPTSAVLMALLHMKRPAALDYLFGDLATPRPDLNQLFIQQRYWHVFRRFVDTSDLQLWLWGDPEAQAFQLEAMRQWYAVNRWKIQQGWWPEPVTE